MLLSYVVFALLKQKSPKNSKSNLTSDCFGGKQGFDSVKPLQWKKRIWGLLVIMKAGGIYG